MGDLAASFQFVNSAHSRLHRCALRQSFGGSFQIFFQVDGTPLQNFRTKNDPEVL